MKNLSLSTQVKWVIALASIFITSLLYVFMTQLCVRLFGLTKVDIVPYSTIMASAVALFATIRLGWWDRALLKSASRDFWIGALCTVVIMITGLSSFANPHLNAATVTVFLKGQLLPEMMILSVLLKERLNRKDVAAFVLSLVALAIPAIGAYLNPAEREAWAVFTTVSFWVLLLLYGAAYMRRTPIIRKYSGNPAYPGNEQIRTFQISTVLTLVLPPVLAVVCAGTTVGKLGQQITTSLYHPTWQKLLAGLLISIPFGLYAPAVVWVMGNATNSSQAGILNKTFANLGNTLASVFFTGVMLVASGVTLTLQSAGSFAYQVFKNKSAPAWYEWVSVGIFLLATYMSHLASEERSAKWRVAEKKSVEAPVTNHTISSQPA